MGAEDEAVQRTTLDHLLEGFQIIRHDFTYAYVNPSAARHAQKTPSELEGRKMHEAYPGVESTPLYEALKKVMAEKVALSFENPFIFADGTTRWFELRCEPVPEGVCVHSFDIDDRKRAEAELHRLNLELEDRIKERTADLQMANEELEAFTSAASHDLRAPLRAIDGYASALLEDYADKLDATARGHLDRIRAGTTRMSRLIEALLTLSRVTRTSIHRTRVDVSECVRAIRGEIEAGGGGRKVSWKIADGVFVNADPTLLRIVLDNLVRNAWNFTLREPNAVIELGQGEAASSFFVRDNGAGFDMKFADRLFSPFQRLHADKEFGGTGIGLATVARIVQRHRGTLKADARVGQGATFTVVF